jgi:hypothetical protein
MVLSSNAGKCMFNFVYFILCTAFHNLQSKLPIDWHTPEDPSPIKTREAYEQAYIKNIYNQQVNKQIQERYKRSDDTFRAIPNEITLQKDRDALTKELEHFNSSRIVPLNSNPDAQPSSSIPIDSYQSHPQLPTPLHIDSQRNRSFNTS